jgi:competence protein ComEA
MARMVIAALALLGLTAMPPALAAQEKPARASSAKPELTGTININTATAADLERLPGIGAKTAGRIIEYRQKNGGFKKIEDLMNVRGIGEKVFLRLRPQITTGAPKAENAAPVRPERAAAQP